MDNAMTEPDQEPRPRGFCKEDHDHTPDLGVRQHMATGMDSGVTAMEKGINLLHLIRQTTKTSRFAQYHAAAKDSFERNRDGGFLK